MPLQSSEILWKRASIMADGNTGGGRVTDTEIASGIRNGIFPDVRQAERLAGSDKRRKVFVHFAAADGAGVIDPFVFVESPTPGGDEIYIHPGTYSDTLADINPSVRHYGAGRLSASASIGDTTISARFLLGGTYHIVQTGDTLRLSAQDDIDDASAAVERVTVSAVSWTGDVATITLAPALSNAFALNAKVASVWMPGDIASTVSNIIVTSAGGSTDSSKASAHPLGAIAQHVTLTFSSASAFSASSDAPGVVLPAGSVNAEYAPDHAGVGSPYFSLAPGFFGGTYTAGDTVTLRVNPQMLPIWYRRIVPANSAATADNACVVAVECETA